MAWPEHDWYDSPRAYDLVYASGTRDEADFLEALLARWSPARGRRIYEPACGSGRLLVELARRGWSVSGSDISEPMLAFARRQLARRGLRGRILRADLTATPVAPGVRLSFCLVSTFKYLQDEASARAHLRAMADLLAPGGLHVLGLHLTDYRERRRVRERWVVQRGGTAVVCNVQTWPPDRRRRSEAVRSRLVVTTPTGTRRSETCWTFRTYDLAELSALLAAEPRLEHVATHDFTHDAQTERPLDGERLDVVLVLRRRAGC